MPETASSAGSLFGEDARARLQALLTRLRAELADDALADLAELERRLSQDRLRILVAGEFKRGKSSLVNALLGREVLPTGVLPLTSLPTVVRCAAGNESTDVARASFRDGRSQTRGLDALTELVTESGNPHNARGVATVEVIVTGTPLPPRVELVDTPGTGSLHVHNTAAAEQALETADAAIFVTAVDPPLSASEADLLTETDNAAVRLLVVVNKADRLDGRECRAAVEYVARATADRLGRAPVEHRTRGASTTRPDPPRGVAAVFLSVTS